MSKIIDYRAKPKAKSVVFKTWRDIERVGLRSGLTPGTLQMLVDRGFGSVKAVRDITEDDLEVLPLYVGQQLAVSKLVDHLNSVLEGVADNEEEEGEEGTTGGQDGEAKSSSVEGGATSDSVQSEVELTEYEKRDLEKAKSAAEAFKRGILKKFYEDQHDDGADDTFMSKLPCPHQFILGKASSKDLNLEEFVYGNLLILEYFIEQRPSEVRASLKHIRFLILKLLHGYPLSGVIEYDTALRKKIGRQHTHLPKEADEALIKKYLMMMTNKVEKKKPKKKAKGKASKSA